MINFIIVSLVSLLVLIIIYNLYINFRSEKYYCKNWNKLTDKQKQNYFYKLNDRDF